MGFISAFESTYYILNNCLSILKFVIFSLKFSFGMEANICHLSRCNLHILIERTETCSHIELMLVEFRIIIDDRQLEIWKRRILQILVVCKLKLCFRICSRWENTHIVTHLHFIILTYVSTPSVTCE